MINYISAIGKKEAYLTINQCETNSESSLPFLREPYLGLGIAVRTFFEQDDVSSSKETRASRLKSWPKQWLPLAEDVEQDFRTCFDFVRALSQGVETLDEKQLSPIEKAVWSNAVKFMDARPF